jgi:hypothetical protein
MDDIFQFVRHHDTLWTIAKVLMVIFINFAILLTIASIAGVLTWLHSRLNEVLCYLIPPRESSIVKRQHRDKQ